MARFLKGNAPVRRTFKYLNSSNLELRENVRIVSFNYNVEGLNHAGTRDFIFWHFDQLQYKNPNVQLLSFVGMTPTPFIRAYFSNRAPVLLDVEGYTQEEVHQRLKKFLCKSDEQLKREAAQAAKVDNPANFGYGFHRHCVCELPGQVPCPGIVQLPDYLRRSEFLVMDKANKLIRRSGARLKAMGDGHQDLHMVIAELRDVKNTAKAFASAQQSATQELFTWSSRQDNRAIQDVMTQLTDLSVLWNEIQMEFIEHVRNFRSQFEMVLEGELIVDSAHAHMGVCEQRESKLKAELKKAAKKATSDELRQMENRVFQAERNKDLAQLEWLDKSREHEIVKLIRIKEGLLKMSDAYLDMFSKGQYVFQAQRDIAALLPDVQGRELADVKYTGSGATKQAVTRARVRVSSHTPGAVGGAPDSDPPRERSYGMFEPPPPYPFTATPPTYSPSAPPYSEQDLTAPSPTPLSQRGGYRRPPSDEELAGAIGGMSLRGESPPQPK
ncbi:unnamed protein product [Cyprideis torosa]|uniref:Small ribosomal subunit protein mS25 n=1 Tax=Cyprideis torosa TaxID=163714 RepID=A0A7R8ZLI5_9CRUS|nr:unnamed protein product [Cyprideis torosa]CAG0882325.1 unnamed protein product [Cyprideis torosa]